MASSQLLGKQALTQKQKILILQPMIGIGDMIWVKPWIDEAIRIHDVVLMAKSSSHSHIIMQEHDIDLRMLRRSERGLRGRHDGIIGFFRLVAEMRQINPDEIWILHRSWRYAAAAYLAGIKSRWGFGMGKQEWFLSQKATLPKQKRGAHPREAVSRLMANREIVPSDIHPRLTATNDQLALAKAMLPDHKSVVVMGVGCTGEDRRWSPENFAVVIRWITSHFPHIHIVLCGSPNERVIGDRIVENLGQTLPQVQLIFDQPLGVVVGIHQLAKLYIGNDTSLINIAAAVGINAIRIYASTLPFLESDFITSLWPEDPERIGVEGSINDILPDHVIALARPHLEAMK
ncbi:MAG: glycosyltransferase family 9 protein [Alphaproteobacteria bacterium]|jgi:heptosyltransferase II|nr:glycosyltransferase family 9 protein [Alphaproteobacteria bacterium]